mmetsp:Transcript_82874/g.130618  ORF Transcript_82874/g.130618 Transcript_82874/m.130618 type:complete len:252 (+) Transcript_82874:218-973(+)
MQGMGDSRLSADVQSLESSLARSLSFVISTCFACGAIARQLLRSRPERLLELLVRIPLHGLGVLQPLDEFHLFFFHLRHQRVCSRSQHFFLSCPSLIVFTELLKLGESILFEPSFGLLLLLLDQISSLYISLSLSCFPRFLLHEILLRLVLRFLGVVHPLIQESSTRSFTNSLGFFAVFSVGLLRISNRFPFRLVELLLCHELLFVGTSKIHYLIGPLTRIFDFLPGLLLFLLQQSNSVRQELRIQFGTLP